MKIAIIILINQLYILPLFLGNLINLLLGTFLTLCLGWGE
jgi:hypothetical protein